MRRYAHNPGQRLRDLEAAIREARAKKIKTILDMRRAGKTYLSIAKSLGVSRSTVAGIVFRHEGQR